MSGYPAPHGADEHCVHYHPGHRVHPLRLRRRLADACGWTPVAVLADVPRQRLVLHPPAGPAVVRYTHDALAVAHRLADRGEPVWHQRANLLGVPADRARRAGRTYVSLAEEPPGPCGLWHDPDLAPGFWELAGRLAGPGAAGQAGPGAGHRRP